MRVLLFAFSFILALNISAQEDSTTIIPRSLNVSFSAAPTYLLASSNGGFNDEVFPFPEINPSFRANLWWDGSVSARMGYEYQTINQVFGTNAELDDRQGSFNSIDLHAIDVAIGQSQFFDIGKYQGAFVITPWVGIRTAFVQPLESPNQTLELTELDTVVSGYSNAIWHVDEQDSVQGYYLQNTKVPSKYSTNLVLSLSFEVRLLERLHLGFEPFYSQGFSPLFYQNIDYEVFDIQESGRQTLFTRGSHYGARFSLRLALWKEKL